jgi:hypothetical protein
MKKLKYLVPFVIILLAIGCGEDFLDQKDLYHISDGSYYRTPQQVEEALAGAYAAVPQSAGNNNPFIVADLMSDDCFGGGGSNDDGFHSTDDYSLVNGEYYLELYQTSWRGILRVNTIITRFSQAVYTDPDQRRQALGEAYFLRGYFYFKLSQFFGPVPLRLEPNSANSVRATADEMYSQIALDLKTAIDSMPSTPIFSDGSPALGHATKWAAEGLMARMFLFYTGYYDKTEIVLPDGTTVTKDMVIAWLDDCINNSGHELLSDFRNNWAYSFRTVTIPYAAPITSFNKYKYAVDNHLRWADSASGLSGNTETVWSIKYSLYAGWNPPGQQLSYSNQHSLYVGLRQQSYIPFGQGWGGGPVNPQLWESFDDNDIRKKGSILNVNVLDTMEATVDGDTIYNHFIWGSDNMWQETGYWQKKYMPIYDSVPDNPATGANEATRLAGIFYLQFASPDNMQLWNMQDDILIRFADILLMAAELGAPNAADYFNDVHTRAGLDPIASPTLDDIKLERRHELAFEGLRYFDLLRWGLDDAKTAIEAANGMTVKYIGVDGTYEITFRTATGGFLPIPQSEITLSEGLLEQTPGWEEYTQ